MSTATPNVNTEEVAKFDALAQEWWDPNGPMKPLHLLNPVRQGYIQQHATLHKATVCDVGCGAGLLSESLHHAGAQVTGIDMSEAALTVAKQHAGTLPITYLATTVEAFATDHKGTFDVVTCMEMLEHVPHPDSVISACITLLKPGGTLFLSTLNRHPKAYLLGVIGAEYILNMLPKGTHDYHAFIRPSELAKSVRNAGATVSHIQGMSYAPSTETFSLSDDVRVNYLLCCQKT